MGLEFHSWGPLNLMNNWCFEVRQKGQSKSSLCLVGYEWVSEVTQKKLGKEKGMTSLSNLHLNIN